VALKSADKGQRAASPRLGDVAAIVEVVRCLDKKVRVRSSLGTVEPCCWCVWCYWDGVDPNLHSFTTCTRTVEYTVL